MDAGWTREDIERRIRDSWRTHELSVDSTPLTMDLLIGLKAAYDAADLGSPPSHIAILYRSMARSHPHRHWLESWADRFNELGESWS